MDNYAEINYKKNMEMLNVAVKYCKQQYSHDDIIKVLCSENDLEKQYCLLILEDVATQNEADILVSNLINHAGPVREACSYKISELISNPKYNMFFQTENITETFVKSVTDINPSISRNAVNILKYVENKKFITKKILEEINKTLSEIDDIPVNRSYEANKKNFNLYWNLEALISLCEYFDDDSKFTGILYKTAVSNDYTVREKTAKLVSLMLKKNSLLNPVAMILRNDANIYVRKYFE